MVQATLRIGLVLLLMGAVWIYSVRGAAIVLDLQNVSGFFCS